MLADLGGASLVILIAGSFCLIALGISALITKIKGGKEPSGKYECGFVNSGQIKFYSDRMKLIPFFILLETMLAWLVFYVASSILLQIPIQHLCFYFFTLTLVICAIYAERFYNK